MSDPSAGRRRNLLAAVGGTPLVELKRVVPVDPDAGWLAVESARDGDVGAAWLRLCRA